MITEIAMVSFITLFMVCAPSGHATGTSLEPYMDPMNPLPYDLCPPQMLFMETP
jgi:hypothetical protein